MFGNCEFLYTTGIKLKRYKIGLHSAETVALLDRNYLRHVCGNFRHVKLTGEALKRS